MSFERSYSRNYGVRIGRLWGIDIWVHWSLVLIVGLQLLNSLLQPTALAASLRIANWILTATALSVSVLLHELGHCFAALRAGGSAERIILWPLGGLALCDAPHDPRSRLAVAMAGPAVNLTLLAVSAGACGILGWPLLPTLWEAESVHLGALLFQYLVLWNVFLLFLNTLPCSPLDGGRMLHSILWWRLRSHEKALAWSLRVGRAVAIGAGVLAILVFFSWLFDRGFAVHHPLLTNLGWGLVLVAVLHFLEVKGGGGRLVGGEPEEGIFGYDFSHGYTSLERTATREPRKATLLSRLREKRRERAETQRRRSDAAVEHRVDDLLVKIHREGVESLTAEERRFLKKASRRFRK